MSTIIKYKCLSKEQKLNKNYCNEWTIVLAYDFYDIHPHVIKTDEQRIADQFIVGNKYQAIVNEVKDNYALTEWEKIDHTEAQPFELYAATEFAPHVWTHMKENDRAKLAFVRDAIDSIFTDPHDPQHQLVKEGSNEIGEVFVLRFVFREKQPKS